MAIPIIYNIRNVAQRPVATFATALGIGLVVAILVGALALAAGFQTRLPGWEWTDSPSPFTSE